MYLSFAKEIWRNVELKLMELSLALVVTSQVCVNSLCSASIWWTSGVTMHFIVFHLCIKFDCVKWQETLNFVFNPPPNFMKIKKQNTPSLTSACTVHQFNPLTVSTDPSVHLSRSVTQWWTLLWWEMLCSVFTVNILRCSHPVTSSSKMKQTINMFCS